MLLLFVCSFAGPKRDGGEQGRRNNKKKEEEAAAAVLLPFNLGPTSQGQSGARPARRSDLSANTSRLFFSCFHCSTAAALAAAQPQAANTNFQVARWLGDNQNEATDEKLNAFLCLPFC